MQLYTRLPKSPPICMFMSRGIQSVVGQQVCALYGPAPARPFVGNWERCCLCVCAPTCRQRRRRDLDCLFASGDTHANLSIIDYPPGLVFVYKSQDCRSPSPCSICSLLYTIVSYIILFCSFFLYMSARNCTGIQWRVPQRPSPNARPAWERCRPFRFSIRPVCVASHPSIRTATLSATPSSIIRAWSPNKKVIPLHVCLSAGPHLSTDQPGLPPLQCSLRRFFVDNIQRQKLLTQSRPPLCSYMPIWFARAQHERQFKRLFL